MNPLVSVVVPAYNVEMTLRACLDSVLAQTYPRLEILLVDDGSEDGTEGICREYAEADERIMLIRRENGGLSAARNTGLDRCSGEMVAFVDSDDVLTPDHIELLYDIMPKDGRGISITNLTPFKGAFSPGHTPSRPRSMEPVEAVREVFYQGDFDTCAAAKLFCRELWAGIRFPEGYVYEDLPTVYRVLLRSESVCYAYSRTYGYRYSANSLDHSEVTSKKIETVALVEGIVSDIDASHPELSLPARCRFASFCFHLLLGARRGSVPCSEIRLLEEKIKGCRSSVLADPSARRKTRCACLLSYAGFGLVRLAFRLKEAVAW